MELQIYRNNYVTSHDDLLSRMSLPLIATTKEREERLELIRGLSLAGQERMEMAEAKGFRALDRTRAQQLLSMFPSHYSMSGREKYLLHRNHYNFDHIPSGALKEITDAQSIFCDVEIWTPQDLDETDPIAVGVIWGPTRASNLYYPIVRWGEELLPFRQLLWNHYLDRVKMAGLFFLFGVAALCAVGCLLWGLGHVLKYLARF